VAQKEETADPLRQKLGRIMAFAAPGPKTIENGQSISIAFLPIHQFSSLHLFTHFTRTKACDEQQAASDEQAFLQI
jgi:hypothetical protein